MRNIITINLQSLLFYQFKSIKTMGAAGSVTMEEVKDMPQYTILGGEAKFNELKGEDGNLDMTKVEDPYL